MRPTEWWSSLDTEQRSIMLHAAMAPTSISLDMLVAVTQTSAIKILTLLEQMVEGGALVREESKAMGYYRFSRAPFIQFALAHAETPQLRKIAQGLISYFDTHLEEGLQKSLTLAHLYQLSGLVPEELRRIAEAADHHLASGRKEDAARCYRIILDAPPEHRELQAGMRLYIDSVIGLVSARGYQVPLEEQNVHLGRALELARGLKDQERIARISLIYGRSLSRVGGDLRRARALVESGCRIARDLGSEGLIRKSEMVMSSFLHWEGHVARAVERYEKVIGSLEEFSSDEEDLRHCAVFGWCYGTLGHTARGLGLIGAVRRKAEELKLEELKSYADNMAALTLLEARRISEAEAHIRTILDQPVSVPGDYVLWQANTAMAYVLYARGDIEGCLAFHLKGMEYSRRHGWSHHRGPWNLDYLEALDLHGPADREVTYESELSRLLSHPDIYMKGVAMRHRAKRRMAEGAPVKEVLQDARESIKLLATSGARLELAQSQILLARLLLRQGIKAQAKALMNETWEVLSAVNADLFPKDLQSYVIREGREDLLVKTMIEVGNTLGAVRNKESLLERIVNLAMRLTFAERGAVFLKNLEGTLDLQASRNLDLAMVPTPKFSSSWKIIGKAATSGQGTLHEEDLPDEPYRPEKPHLAWMISSPITFQDQVLGVLYLDSTSRRERDLERELALLKALGNQVAVALDNVRAYEEIASLKNRLEQESRFFQTEVEQSKNLDQIVGKSSAIRLVQQQVQKVAPTGSAVLITGETGVGKELMARAIHRLSSRSGGPFIPVNIASLSEGLIPSELFGHEKGAFTGAAQMQAGRFELADQGTLFLDDIQNLSTGVQMRLLRAIQEKEFERVGGTKPIRSDFRVIAATNVPLEQMVASGAFRSDLFYRLNVFPIFIPPLSSRRDDIPLLALHFLELYNKKLSKNIQGIATRDMKRLIDYNWPGNVRELAHVIERAVILSEGKSLHLPGLEPVQVGKAQPPQWLTLAENEKAHILKALSECGWRVSGPHGAAALLDVKPTTLFAKMKKLGIHRKRPHPDN